MHYKCHMSACLAAAAKRVLPGVRAQPTSLLPAMQEWLGLGTVDPVALWLLFLSFSSSVLQVHNINWMRCVHQQPGQQQPQQEEQQQQERRRQAQGRLSRGGSFDGIESPRAGMSAPLLANIPQQSQQEQHTTVQITASPLDLEASPAAALASGRDDITASLLWQPMALAAQGQWHWQDWARYFIYRLGIIAGAPHCLPACLPQIMHLPSRFVLPHLLQALPRLSAGVRRGPVHPGERLHPRRLPRARAPVLPQSHHAAHSAQQVGLRPVAVWPCNLFINCCKKGDASYQAHHFPLPLC
jgi:hypothetical protein